MVFHYFIKNLKIFNRSVAAELFCYLTLSICGYLSLLGTTPSIIVLRSPLNPGDADIAMVIGKFAVTISLFIGLPVNLHPGRAQLTMLIKKKEFHSNSLHIILTVLMVFISTMLAIVYPKIVSAISFIGGTLSVLFGVTLPCFLFFFLI